MADAFWNDPAVLLLILLAIRIVDSLWAVYLMLREIMITYRVKVVPVVIQPYLPQALFDRMRANKLHKGWLIVVNTLFVVVICGCLELYFGFYPFLWRLAGQCAIWQWMRHEICVSIVFLVLLSIYTALKTLPGNIYARYCIPSLINHPKPRWLYRIISELLNILCSLLIIAIVVSVVVLLVRYAGHFSFLALYLVSIFLTVLLVLILPSVIDPLFGKRVPLENGALKADLEQLTSRLGFPMRQVYLIRVRDPTVGSNAFFFGSCCLKRIVIFDTLLLNRGLRDPSVLPPEELGKGLHDPMVVAVVAHELGHWKCGHFYKAILMVKIHLVLTILLFAVCFLHGPIYQAVGFEAGLQPTIVGFVIIFGFVMTPYFTISNVIMLTVTRQFEYQADKFAFKLGYAANLKEALLKLYADNLSFPISDVCYSSWNHTHPMMLHRLKRLDQLEASRTRT